MTDFGWNYPPGVSQLPGESRAEQAYQRAYEDDAGYALAVRQAWASRLELLVPATSVDRMLALDTAVLVDLALALDMEDVPTREEYAQAVAEDGYPGDDDREEPYE